jgi:hypothetical protein
MALCDSRSRTMPWRGFQPRMSRARVVRTRLLEARGSAIEWIAADLTS